MLTLSSLVRDASTSVFEISSSILDSNTQFVRSSCGLNDAIFYSEVIILSTRKHPKIRRKNKVAFGTKGANKS